MGRLVAALVLLAPVACSRAEALDDAAVRRATRAQAAAVEDLRATASALDRRVDDLEDALRTERSAKERLRERLARRMKRLDARLRRAIAALDAQLADATGVTATASRALAQVRAVSRDLAVLDKRLDYHLARHGSR